MEDDLLAREQLSALGGLLHMGFKEIMLLSWDGKAQQAAELADALFQIPLHMFSHRFSCEPYARRLQDYQNRHRDDRPANLDYAQMLRRIEQNKRP